MLSGSRFQGSMTTCHSASHGQADRGGTRRGVPSQEASLTNEDVQGGEPCFGNKMKQGIGCKSQLNMLSNIRFSSSHENGSNEEPQISGRDIFVCYISIG